MVAFPPMNLLETIRELRTVAKWCLKTATGLEQFLKEDKSMSLATQVISGLQQQNQTLTNNNLALTQQIQVLQQQIANSGSAAQQLATLQAEGAIESPADLNTIQTAATAMGITFDPTDGGLIPPVNNSGGAPVVQVQTVAPIVPSPQGSSGTVTAATSQIIPPANPVSAAATVPLADQAGRTVYAYTGDPTLPVDSVTWPSAGTYENKPIYYFKGDTSPGQTNGATMVGFALIMVPVTPPGQ